MVNSQKSLQNADITRYTSCDTNRWGSPRLSFFIRTHVKCMRLPPTQIYHKTVPLESCTYSALTNKVKRKCISKLIIFCDFSSDEIVYASNIMSFQSCQRALNLQMPLWLYKKYIIYFIMYIYKYHPHPTPQHTHTSAAYMLQWTGSALVH